MPELQIKLLGSPIIEVDHTPVEVSSHKAIALLIYPAVNGQVTSRDSLATMFWPDLNYTGGKKGRKIMTEKPRPAIQGKVVIVTGASSGIGETTARLFGEAGAKVVLAARRAERLEHLAEEIRAAGGTTLPVPTDLTDQAQITHLVQTTLAEFGRIDVLANIAGWGRYDWFEELTPEDLREQYEVNILGMAELTRQVLPAMKAQKSGHIINMSSYASKIAVPPLTVYASTKYAIEGLTDGLRRELIPWGIQVSRVHPSGVRETEFNRQAGRQGGIRYRSLPIGKVSREQVAEVILSLVEHPRRAVFLSRLYDIPVVVNELAPGLVDAIMSLWVRRKRAQQLKAAAPIHKARYPDPAAWILLAGSVLSLVAIGRKVVNNRKLTTRTQRHKDTRRI